MCSQTSTLKSPVTCSCCLKVPLRSWAMTAQTINQFVLTTVSLWFTGLWRAQNHGSDSQILMVLFTELKRWETLHVVRLSAMPVTRLWDHPPKPIAYCPCHSLNQGEISFKFLHMFTQWNPPKISFSLACQVVYSRMEQVSYFGNSVSPG